MGQKKTLQSEEQRFVDLTIAADDMGWRSHLPPAVLLRPLAVEDLHFLVSAPAGCTKKKSPPANWRAKVTIGIGGTVTLSPLPHHRTCGSAYGGSAG